VLLPSRPHSTPPDGDSLAPNTCRSVACHPGALTSESSPPTCRWGAGGDNVPPHFDILTPSIPTVLTTYKSFTPRLIGTMRWRFAFLLSMVATPALAAQSQCRLVLSSLNVRPTPPTSSVNPQSSHHSSTVPVASTPTPTPLVPFSYGSEPIRGVNLCVLLNAKVELTHLEAI